MSLATSIASSKLVTLMSAVTGPKISSCAMRAFWLDVAPHRRLVEEAVGEVAVGGALAAGEQRGAVGLADLAVAE